MTPKFIAVAAVAEDNAIAEETGLPWDTVEEDLRQYKERVHGHPLVVGRKTYESLLKYDNQYIYHSPAAVLTTNEQYETEEDFHTPVHSKEDALEWVNSRSEDIVYNLGGGQVYHLFFNNLDELVISHMPVISDNPTAEFPEINKSEWDIISKECFSDFTLVRYSC